MEVTARSERSTVTELAPDTVTAVESGVSAVRFEFSMVIPVESWIAIGAPLPVLRPSMMMWLTEFRTKSGPPSMASPKYGPL